MRPSLRGGERSIMNSVIVADRSDDLLSVRQLHPHRYTRGLFICDFVAVNIRQGEGDVSHASDRYGWSGSSSDIVDSGIAPGIGETSTYNVRGRSTGGLKCDADGHARRISRQVCEGICKRVQSAAKLHRGFRSESRSEVDIPGTSAGLLHDNGVIVNVAWFDVYCAVVSCYSRSRPISHDGAYGGCARCHSQCKGSIGYISHEGST
mmetsp:Transcript_4817/g.7645  ORF Transcript_4817/g.7645 Transcript_4817/m.7645 type:complete len:207 (-) Transcript_4817:3887-4507(-)